MIYILLVTVMLSFAQNLIATGILVDPSFVKVENVTPGKTVELIGIQNCFLKIINRNTKAARYRISIISCKEYGKPPNPGYIDIPDTEWFTVKSTEIIVPANTTECVNGFYIKIPKKRRFFNQRYQAIVKVEKKPGTGEMINLEVILPLWIETERKRFSFLEKLFP